MDRVKNVGYSPCCGAHSAVFLRKLDNKSYYLPEKERIKFLYTLTMPIRSVSLSYDHTTAGTVVMWRQFIHEWSAIVRLYKPVLEFAPVINDYANQLNMEVRSFSYKRLTMAYGKDKANTVTIRWEPERKCFTLPLGTGGSAKAANCHVIIMEQLRQEFNQHQNIAQLMQ
ncbi:mediator of RNA polymerase II transcription subunit 14-like, partial [Anneissia japonica]|uniref:mediator of RNA polymerase II transcription subunit 14-like n=1 Tax=Anneissia japonica TaxID=1529436 RepID=UPI00142588BF